MLTIEQLVEYILAALCVAGALTTAHAGGKAEATRKHSKDVRTIAENKLQMAHMACLSILLMVAGIPALAIAKPNVVVVICYALFTSVAPAVVWSRTYYGTRAKLARS